MANVTVTTSQPNITVNANTQTVNVSTTTSNILVSNIATVSNADVRSSLSVVDAGGDGSLTYSNTTGIFTYTGPSQAEVVAHFSNVSPVNLEANGQISIDESALFSGKTTDDLAEGSTNLYLNGTGTTDDLTEGSTNLYYTNARVNAYVIAAGLDFNAEKVDDRVANLMQTSGNLSYSYDDGANTLTLSQSLTTTDISEGDNFYFTDARANSAITNFLPTYTGTITAGTLEASNIDIAHISPITLGGNITLEDGSVGGGNASLRLAIHPEGVPTPSTSSEEGVDLGDLRKRFKNIHGHRHVARDIVGANATLGIASLDGATIGYSANMDASYKIANLEIRGFIEDATNSSEWDTYGNPKLGFRESTPPGEGAFGERTAEIMWRNAATADGSDYPLWYGQRSLLPVTLNQARLEDKYTIGEYDKAYHTNFAIGQKTNRIFLGDGSTSAGNNTIRGYTSRSAVLYLDSGGTTPKIGLGYSDTDWATDTDTLTYNTYGNLVDTEGDYTLDGAITIDDLTSDDITAGNITASGNITGAWVNGLVSTNQLVQRVNNLGNISGNVAINTQSGGTFTGTAIGDITGFNFSNIVNGTSFTIKITQDLVGGRALDTTTGFSNWKFVDEFTTLSSDPSATDLLSVQYDGTNYIASLVNFEAPDSLSLPGNISGGGLTITGEATITGNLEVQGNIDYVNVVDLLVNDQSITLNYGNASARDGFIYIDRSGSGSANVNLKWNETTDRWQFTNDGSTYYDLPTSTSDITEGSNLYFTDARARASLSTTTSTPSGNGALSYDSGTGVFDFTPADVPDDTDELSEGATNLYYTTDRANAAIQDYLDGTNVVISSDSNITTTANIQGDYVIADTAFEGDLNGAVMIDVYNGTGATLSKGDVVYLTGAETGDNPHVALADSDDATKMPAIGVVKEQITDTNVGQVVTSGEMNFNSHGHTLGADLYVDTTAGALTTTVPTGEDKLIQKIGKVVGTNHILVQGAFRTNATPNLNDGNIFVGNASNQAVTADLSNFGYEIVSNANIESTLNVIGNTAIIRDTVDAGEYQEDIPMTGGNFYAANLLGATSDPNDIVIDIGDAGYSFSRGQASLTTGVQISFANNTGSASANLNSGTFFIGGSDLSGGANSTYLMYTDSNLSTKANARTLGFTTNGNEISISGITQASPAVVTTSSAHGLSTNDFIRIGDVAGMTQINGAEVYVEVLTSTTLQLYSAYGPSSDYDTTSYSAYTSGGTLGMLWGGQVTGVEGGTGNVLSSYVIGDVDINHTYDAGEYKIRDGYYDKDLITYDTVSGVGTGNSGGNITLHQKTNFDSNVYLNNYTEQKNRLFSKLGDSNTSTNGYNMIGGGAAIDLFNSFGNTSLNRETGYQARQSGTQANTLFTVPRFAMTKYGGDIEGNVLTTNIGNVIYATNPGDFAGVFDSKTNRRRGYTLASDPDNYYFAEGAAPHSVGSILFRTDPNSNVLVAGSEPLSPGNPYTTRAPVSQGIITFRTMQPAVAANVASAFPYNEGTDDANSTVAFINDKFNIGNEEDSTKAYSFPKEPGANNTILVNDANNDLQFEDFETKLDFETRMDGFFENMLRKYIGTINFINAEPGGAKLYSANYIDIHGGFANTTVFDRTIDGGNA